MGLHRPRSRNAGASDPFRRIERWLSRKPWPTVPIGCHLDPNVTPSNHAMLNYLNVLSSKLSADAAPACAVDVPSMNNTVRGQNARRARGRSH